MESDERLRFKKSRSYPSRLAELDFARWLEAEKWIISNLEIYGGLFDVQASDANQRTVSFEIKYLAQHEVVFELIRDSFTNTTAVGSLGAYSQIGYLLFRVYQAARQLKESTAYRIVAAVVSDYQLSYKIHYPKTGLIGITHSFLKEIQKYFRFSKRSSLKIQTLMPI